MIEALESALQYAGGGWSVLPCRDKVPLVRDGVHAATRDLATIERWWHTWPQANVAIACGAPSGIVVIDIDSPAEVTELFNLTTLSASTPSGGRHLYCRYVEGIRNRVFDWGELRADGLYVVAPPADGRAWISHSVIADVPEHLVKIGPNIQTVTSLPTMEWADAIADHNKTVARWGREESFALVAYRNALNRVLNAKHRMIALNAETYALGRIVSRGWIARSNVVRGMEAASRHNGLIAKRGLDAVRAVILGALRKGEERPYPDLAPREVTVGGERTVPGRAGEPYRGQEGRQFHSAGPTEPVSSQVPIQGPETGSGSPKTVAERWDLHGDEIGKLARRERHGSDSNAAESRTFLISCGGRAHDARRLLADPRRLLAAADWPASERGRL